MNTPSWFWFEFGSLGVDSRLVWIRQLDKVRWQLESHNTRKQAVYAGMSFLRILFFWVV